MVPVFMHHYCGTGATIAAQVNHTVNVEERQALELHHCHGTGDTDACIFV
jgi:hypothetical protein